MYMIALKNIAWETRVRRAGRRENTRVLLVKQCMEKGRFGGTGKVSYDVTFQTLFTSV